MNNKPNHRWFQSRILATTLLALGMIALYAALASFDLRVTVTHAEVLAARDGRSYRGDRMIGHLANSEQLLELSRRYKNVQDFENRQEYLLRLLDYYLFSKDRLTGMRKEEIEEIFGPVRINKEGSVEYTGGRDLLFIEFANGKVKSASYCMGF